MKTFELNKIRSCDDLIKQTPKKEHYSLIINENTLFTKNGEAVGLYIKIASNQSKSIRAASLNTKYLKSSRTRGVQTQSSVFGSLPRIARRNDYCRFSAQTKNEKTNANILFSFLPHLTDIYKQYLPAQYNHDLNVISENVKEDYIIQQKAPFTTANINVNHAIKYHRDTGNFRGNLSNVLILRDGIAGGELVFPEYGFALAQEDSYLAIFDGQSEIHGVMPIIKTKENPYRASIVYYTLENMKHCYPFKMEVERLQNVAAVRANRRAENIDPTKK
jgi:hypothetical protein